MDKINAGIILAASFVIAAAPRMTEASPLLANTPVVSADYRSPLQHENDPKPANPTNTPLPGRRIECPQATIRKVRSRYPR
jgi:hypothetical protein